MSELLEITVDKFKLRVAADRLYTRDGLWVLGLAAAEGARVPRVRVGVSDYLQRHNGDLAFASVKRVGTRLAAGEELAEVETVKVNLSLLAPVSGTVVEVNPVLELTPEIVNRDPYGEGWLAVIEAAELEAEEAALLDGAAYFDFMRGLVEQELAS
ncbi:MAG: glycine cleavage system protein H [Deltaproteobacteria bacterium]|nr:glycine cleavage system protein H [Deltaproteobacteria bacterium]